MKKQVYTPPQVILVELGEKVSTLDTVSGNKEGSSVLVSWLVD